MSTAQGIAPPERRIEHVSHAPGDPSGVVIDMYNRHNDKENPFSMAKTAEGGSEQEVLYHVLHLIEGGTIRAAWVDNGVTYVDPVVGAAIGLLFPLCEMELVEIGPYAFHDKIPLQTNFVEMGVRVVPLGVVRRYCHLEEGVIVMPGYVNLGANVGGGSMVDTFATVGSSAQVGGNTHLSGGVGLGGVLEPPGLLPTIIGSECFIGSRCQVVSGALVEDGGAMAMGTSFQGKTPVVGLNGEPLTPGVVPAWSTVVPDWYTHWEFDADGQPDWASMLNEHNDMSARYRVRVVEQREPGQRHDATSLNELLRDQAVIG